MRFRHPVNLLIYLLINAICRVDTSEVHRIPMRGPLIIVTNHVTFLEVPILYTFLLPRRVIGVTKEETWRSPILGYLADLWRAIPIRRNSVDSVAFEAVLTALDAGRIVAIAPEGTRSRHGRLSRAGGGVVTLAARSGAPVLPVAHYGGERIWQNLKSLRRTRFIIRVGTPLWFSPEDVSKRSARRRSLETVMRSLASLMPERYHGYYATLTGESRAWTTESATPANASA